MNRSTRPSPSAVAGAHARRPADAVEPRGLRRVDEPSAHVAIHPDPRRLPGGHARARRPAARAGCRSASPVDPPSSSRIDHRHAAAVGLDDEALARHVAVGDRMREAGLTGHVDEAHGPLARRFDGAAPSSERGDAGAGGERRARAVTPRLASRAARRWRTALSLPRRVRAAAGAAPAGSARRGCWGHSIARRSMPSAVAG